MKWRGQDLYEGRLSSTESTELYIENLQSTLRMLYRVFLLLNLDSSSSGAISSRSIWINLSKFNYLNSTSSSEFMQLWFGVNLLRIRIFELWLGGRQPRRWLGLWWARTAPWGLPQCAISFEDNEPQEVPTEQFEPIRVPATFLVVFLRVKVRIFWFSEDLHQIKVA